jgi:ATP-binding protein involved in chromosome partitioning
MTATTQEQIKGILAGYCDPALGVEILPATALKQMTLEAGVLSLELCLGFPAQHYQDLLRQQLQQRFSAIPGVNQVDVKITWEVVSHAVQRGLKGLSQVKNIIAVAAGKGGVGKSTTAVNLALAIAAEGAKVGLLDADIYGPNQPHMLGVAQRRPESLDGQRLQPVECHGIQTMSIGYLVTEKAPMVWRGPMASGALQQLFQDTLWQDLDYLIVDMPPGTGDIQLTLAQKVPVSGAVIVTTPQDIALLDVKKAINMFNKVAIPTLGVVENMAAFHCEACGHVTEVFGEGGAQALAEEFHIGLLGRVPLHRAIREACDKGLPTMLSAPESEIGQRYKEIARRVLATLSLRARDYSSKFPNIVIK